METEKHTHEYEPIEGGKQCACGLTMRIEVVSIEKVEEEWEVVYSSSPDWEYR